MPTSKPVPAPGISGEQHSGYEAWKLKDFGQERRIPSRSELPTVRQLELLREQAHAAGHAEGYAEGARTAQAEVARLQGLMAGLDCELRHFDQDIAAQLVTLALDVARQLVKDVLHRNPGQIIGVVKEAMQALPPFGEHAQLLLHPHDAALLRAHIGDHLAHSKWKLIEDSSIERGGCRVQTASMQVDATLQTRWRRMAASLARDDAWFAEDSGAADEAGPPVAVA